MAEGLLRHDAGNQFDVFSAGVEPTQVRQLAIAVMQEAGIDISGQRSKSVDEFVEQEFDYVITVCDNANQQCPLFLARPSASTGALKIRRQQWATKKNGSMFFAVYGMNCAKLREFAATDGR